MSKLQEIVCPANWELTSPKQKLFSGDQVLDAYLQGKNKGLEQAQKLILEKLNDNIIKSGNHTSELLFYLNKSGFNPQAAYLKINSWDDFTVLIILPEKEFVDEKIDKVYDYFTDFEGMISEKLYHIHISICDNVDGLDESYIHSDGFVLKHITNEKTTCHT